MAVLKSGYGLAPYTEPTILIGAPGAGVMPMSVIGVPPTPSSGICSMLSRIATA